MWPRGIKDFRRMEQLVSLPVIHGPEVAGSNPAPATNWANTRAVNGQVCKTSDFVGSNPTLPSIYIFWREQPARSRD